MRRRGLVKILVVLCFAGCADKPQARQPAAAAKPATKGAVLTKPIGIATVQGAFTPLINAGQPLPFTFSDTFTNKTNGGPEILVHLMQKDETGTETIASLIIAIPPVADNALQVTVTLKIASDRKMTVKTTVAQTAKVQEFGPFPVD